MSTHVDTHTASKPGMKTLKSYVLGLFLSLLLTMASFALVAIYVDKLNYWPMLTRPELFITLSILALVQLVVQVLCFLRLNASEEGRWELMPFLFTILIAIILVSGTLWIMYNLNYNMAH